MKNPVFDMHNKKIEVGDRVRFLLNPGSKIKPYCDLIAFGKVMKLESRDDKYLVAHIWRENTTMGKLFIRFGIHCEVV